MSLLFTVMGSAVDSELSPGCDRDSGHPLLLALLIRRAACRGSGVSVYKGLHHDLKLSHRASRGSAHLPSQFSESGDKEW